MTRKISDGVARIKLGMADTITLGNLDGGRDWGFAGDYVKAMWLMLQQDEPRDYVIATGKAHTVRNVCEAAFAHVDLDYRDHVVTDPKFLRPAEVDRLLGDSSRAREDLGWRPNVSFEQLVAMMVDADMERLWQQKESSRKSSSASSKRASTSSNGSSPKRAPVSTSRKS